LDRDELVSVAWLHDVGYAPQLRATGFHALDGARFLVSNGVSIEVATLVANHSCALIEAGIRGLDDDLRAEFPMRDDWATDALYYADMTCGPTGEIVTVEERLRESRGRYGPGHVVTRFIDAAEHLGISPPNYVLVAPVDTYESGRDALITAVYQSIGQLIEADYRDDAGTCSLTSETGSSA